MKNSIVPDYIRQIADMPHLDRQRYLESNADDIKEGIYYHEFSEEEIDHLRTANAQADVEIRNTEEQLKKATEPLKQRLKELRNAKKHTVTHLKEGREQVDGVLYIIADLDTKLNYHLDNLGNLINTSPITTRQASIFMKTAADGTNG